MKVKARVRKYEDISPVEFIILRDRLGIKRYRKTIKRDEEERKILLNLGLKKIEESERDDYITVGYKRKRLKIL